MKNDNYNIKTAEYVADAVDIIYVRETLMKAKNGEYFIHSIQRKADINGEQLLGRLNQWDKISPVSRPEAEQWCKERNTPNSDATEAICDLF